MSRLTNQPNRLDIGGMIDRTKLIEFTFDGKKFNGFEGDTLASALLANNVKLMGRSFKYHRPRGVMTAGSEEPNAIVELRSGARQEPNSRATVTELFGGLEARSQNRWPSLKFDAMAINDLFSNFLTAGFYYKTFMWPAAFWEKLYEPIIRNAAGLGSLSAKADPDSYDKGFLHCDLLIIGAGPSGLAAALTAARAGANIIIADEDFVLGGRLNAETYAIGDASCADWALETITELNSMNNVRRMPRTTVIGAFDHGVYGAVERISDHLAVPSDGKPRQVLWRIYSKRAILAGGAIERPICFPNNDRPGIMQASAIRSYVNRWASTPASQIAIFTNNDNGYRTATDLRDKGIDVSAIIDTRSDAPKCEGIEVLAGGRVVDTSGRLGLNALTVSMNNGTTRTIKCGALGVAGGWNPNVHLTCHQRGFPQWQQDIAAFVPGGTLPVGLGVAGAANGQFSLASCLSSGVQTAISLLGDIDIDAKAITVPKAEDAPIKLMPFWHVRYGKKRAWVDQQNDVTVKDIKLAHQENFRSIEHLKRYTTLGMATDQGKTSNISGLAIMAELSGKSISDVGTTIFRPPYTPTAIGVMAGRAHGRHFRPTRLTPSHKWAQEQGAVFVEAGMWLRAQWYPQPGETHWRESVDREVLATRASVGVCDVTSLGKIDIQGNDATTFINRVYANGFAKLPIGKTRYGLMLREDGIVMDDGTTARLDESHYIMTTTTANAVGVFRHLEFCRQCLWPDLDVHLISTTESWAQYAIAGPNARKLLEKIIDPEFDLSNDAFPFMACGKVTVCGGLRARLFRISFSGELAYELAVPTRYGDALIRRIIEVGEAYHIVPYGTEALGVMRIEKGHAAGNELNGTTTALNLGLGRMVSATKDSIGNVLSRREGLTQKDAIIQIGLKPVNDADALDAGAHLMRADAPVNAAHDQGYVTSVCYSPCLGHSIGLGFLSNGSNRTGEIIRAVNPLQGREILVEVVSPHFIDPKGKRLHA